MMPHLITVKQLALFENNQYYVLYFISKTISKTLSARRGVESVIKLA